MNNNAQKIYLRHRFFTSLAFTMVFTVASIYYIEKIGLNPLQLVIVGTILELSYFLFEVPTGVVADVYSRKLSIIIGLCLTGLGFFIEGFFPVFVAVIVSQIFWGIGATFLSGAVTAWVTNEIGTDNIQDLFLSGAQYSQVASLIGLVTSIGLGYYSLQLPILVGAIIFFGLVVHHTLEMKEHSFTPLSKNERETWSSLYNTFLKGLRFIKNNKVLIIAIVITLFYGLYSEGIDRLWNMHFIEDIGFPCTTLKPIIWFGFINAGSMFIMIFITSKLKRYLKNNKNLSQISILLVLNALLVIGILSFAFSINFYLGVMAIWSIKILRKVNGPIFSAYLNSHIKSEVRATVLSTISQFDALGQIIGGPIIGLIALKLSVGIAIAFSAILLMPVVLIFAIAKYRT